tara:strand:+ start:8094 stop:8576 length:483 start_codon:yes stop_codon:yes gene_type:complete
MQKSAQPNTRSTKQGGFTLIELMIVVAIIGVLASIAVPQYQNYVGRAQVSEAISLAASAKTAVSEYYITNGDWPEDNAQAGVSEPGDISGSYVSQVEIADGTGLIVVSMKADDVVDAIANKRLVFEPSPPGDNEDGTIQWNCRPATSNQIPNRFLPASCR